MVALTFPDGARRDFRNGVTGFDIAKGISPSLAKRTVAMALDGLLAADEFDLGVALDGSFRSASKPSSAMATVRLASEGEMPLAISNPVTPLGKSRRAPSGKVKATIVHSCCSLAAYECR